MDFKGKAHHFWSAATPHKDCFYLTSEYQEVTFSSVCLLPRPPRQEVDLKPRGQRCTSWWRGSGRRLRSTDRPAPSAVKATSMCKKNVRSFFLQMSISCSWYLDCVSPSWFLQGHLPSGQVGSNVTVHLSKSRRSCTWWPLTTDLVGSLWVATEHIKHLAVFTFAGDPLI